MLHIAEACALLKTFRKHDAMAVVKTWVNSWATSSRFHAAVQLPCLLGCIEGTDAQHHYVQCVHIRSIVDDLVTLPLPDPPVQRMGMHEPSVEILRTLSAVFSAYHAVRRSGFVLGLNDSPLDSGCASAAHHIFADAFVSAAEDVCLPCRAARSFTSVFEIM